MQKPGVKNIVIGILILVAFSVIVGISGIDWKSRAKGVHISTDKSSYQGGEMLKVKISNDGKNEVCLSSCYPYVLEKRNGAWKRYSYEQCAGEDRIEKCVDPETIKAFELQLPKAISGTHRLAVPACISCTIRQDFKGDSWLFSNPFVIR